MRQDRLFLLFLANVEIMCKQNDVAFTLKRGNMSLEEAINVFNNILNKRATFTVKESDYDHYFNDPDYNDNDYEYKYENDYEYKNEYEYEYKYEED